MHTLLPFVVRLHRGNYADINFNRYSDVTSVEKQIWRPIDASTGCPGSEHPVAELPGVLLFIGYCRTSTGGISNMFDIYKSRLWRLWIDLVQQNNHFHTKYLRSLWKINHLWPGLGSGNTPRSWRGGDLGKSSQPARPAYETSQC